MGAIPWPRSRLRAWTKRLVCFNLVSERYIHSYIMNPETNNIHALIKNIGWQSFASVSRTQTDWKYKSQASTIASGTWDAHVKWSLCGIKYLPDFWVIFGISGPIFHTFITRFGGGGLQGIITRRPSTVMPSLETNVCWCPFYHKWSQMLNKLGSSLGDMLIQCYFLNKAKIQPSLSLPTQFTVLAMVTVTSLHNKHSTWSQLTW